MLRHIILLALLFSVSCVVAEKKRFDNFKSYNLNIENNGQLKALQSLEALQDGYLFLESPTKVGMKIPILVPPTKETEFSKLIANIQIEVTLGSSNVQELIDAEIANAPKVMEWETYHTLEEINTWLDEMVALHPQMSSEDIGVSHENRRMRVIKISYRSGNPGLFIESHIHAREWITSATVTWIINELLTSTNTIVREIAENYDWYIIPVFNVDGMAYTHSTDRMWRKTRSPQANGCFGVDGNRNFGYRWMQGGASSNPCSDTFAGTEPYSEIETKNLIDYYVTIAQNINLYLSFHSYGQYLLFPYALENSRAPNHDDLMQIGTAAGNALRSRNGIQYTVGNHAEALYVASGNSIDWAYGTAGTKLSFLYEFRDNGVDGFLLPTEQIIPNAEEVLDSLVALLGEAKTLGYMAQRN